MKGLNGFTLKIIAMVLMVMDHLYTFINGHGGIVIPIGFAYLGKLAAPVFFYLIVEGFFHTSNREKYMLRLFGMGIFMVGMDFVLGIHNNIFLSLGCGVALLSTIEMTRKSERGTAEFFKGMVLCVSVAFLMLFTEASLFGLAMVLIFYGLRTHKLAMAVVFVVISALPLLSVQGSNFVEAAFIWDYQWMMLFSIVLILMYNGKPGPSKNVFAKWFFYIFYPAHLAILVISAKLLGA